MSRFAYHTGVDDQPLEGGVRAATPNKRAPGKPHAATNGVPGPEETLLDITELVRNVGMQYVHTFAIPADYEPELSAVAPIVGRVTLTNAGATLLLRGNVATHLNMECGRCLEPRIEPVEAELEESYDLITGFHGRHNDEIEAVDSENPEAPVISANVLNLGELLRQILLVAAPLTPTCGDECPNLLKIPRWGTEGSEQRAPLSRLGELLRNSSEDADSVV
jgi:uncharacterized metal-binding protein YceD (DUF177 family)